MTMKLEICLEASNLLKDELLSGLAALVTKQHIAVTAAKHCSNRFMLNVTIKEQSPDLLLHRIDALVAKLENHYPGMHTIEVHVRDVRSSEPAISSEENADIFSPVEGIRIIPWNGGNNTITQPRDILLEPAHAFGTGLHPSTRLCLHFLKQLAGQNSKNELNVHSVLDIGCGSGILSVAARRLGALRVLGIEIDPNAAQVARRNIQINRLTDSVQVIRQSWHAVSGRYDLVLANLVPSVLFKAASFIPAFLKEQGLLITAGFPASSNRKVFGLFEKSGLRLLDESSSDGWGGLLIIK
jgi:ribosomal protein L11 methyltransferase